jgi:hypothetical protein
MRVATLYDIHGNLAALEAVLAEVPEEANDRSRRRHLRGWSDPSETLETGKPLAG